MQQCLGSALAAACCLLPPECVPILLPGCFNVPDWRLLHCAARGLPPWTKEGSPRSSTPVASRQMAQKSSDDDLESPEEESIMSDADSSNMSIEGEELVPGRGGY